MANQSSSSGKRGGRRPGAGRPRGAVSETTREIREICRSISLGNPKVVSRLQREAELGTINPALLINLIDRGWGRPIPMGAEKPKQDPVLFVTTHGRVPWDPAVDPGRERSAQMIAAKEAEERLALDAKKTPVVIDQPKPEDEGESLELVRLPDEPFVHPHVRERDREPRGRS